MTLCLLCRISISRIHSVFSPSIPNHWNSFNSWESNILKLPFLHYGGQDQVGDGYFRLQRHIWSLCSCCLSDWCSHIPSWPCTPAGWTQGSSLMVTSWTRVWVVPFWTSFFCLQVINSRHWEPCFFLFSGFHIWGRICALCVFLCLIFFT